MRVIDAVVAIIFMLFALTQINDRDPAYWILVYGGTAVVALAAVFARFSSYWTVMISGAAASGMIIAFNGFIAYFFSGDPGSLTGPMLAEKPWVEPAREFLGLGFSLAALLWYQKRAFSKRS